MAQWSLGNLLITDTFGLKFFILEIMVNYFISSPLEQFEVIPYISLNIPLLGTMVFSVTNLTFYAVIMLVLFLVFHVIANNNYSLVPSSWSVMLESLYVTLQNMTRDQIGQRYEIFTPLVYSIFIMVLFLNLGGNIPYSFAVTTSAVVCLGMSVLVFVSVTILAVVQHGMHSLSFFVPAGTPLILVPILVLIETISYLARSVSLGLRLFANIAAGHTLLHILASFLGQMFSAGLFIAVITLIPYVIFIALIGLELAVAFIQAYVFSVLVCSYLKDSLDLH